MQFIQHCLMQIDQTKYGELLRYLVTGSIALLLHLLVLYFLVENFKLDKTFASGVGFVCATLVNYFLQKTFVFKSSVNLVSSFAIYCAITVSTLILNVALFWLLSNATDMHYLFVQIVTTVVIFVLNYYLNRNVTFMQR